MQQVQMAVYLILQFIFKFNNQGSRLTVAN